MLIWAADQVVFDKEDWRQTCAFACSSCLFDFSSCDVDEFNLASLVLSSVRKLWNKRFKHVSMVFERTGEKLFKTYLQKLPKPGFCLPAPGSFSQPARALVEDCQVLAGLLHSAKEKEVKSRQEKSKGAKLALDQMV